jgi:hypothetical protein
MAENIIGSKMPTFPSQAVKKPRAPQKFYRGSVIQERADAQPDTGYGENGFTGSSSVMSTGKVASQLSDIDIAPPKGDPTLAAVVAGGAASADTNWQTRDLSKDKTAGGRPAAHGMVRQQGDIGSLPKVTKDAGSDDRGHHDPRLAARVMRDAKN